MSWAAERGTPQIVLRAARRAGGGGRRVNKAFPPPESRWRRAAGHGQPAASRRHGQTTAATVFLRPYISHKPRHGSIMTKFF
ncbi:hypothetical protein E2C01_082322 [Portunus trituberculatus]|uniref:Uncharacterized protein n=1 Tax=Portunus trituberculatus TaxID=210409 RepID=A0A5B7IS16_PORTR|nr:hypothetical protein [Portunus trituberculatus]